MHGSNVNYEANPLLSLAGFIGGLPELSASLAEQLSYLTVAPTAINTPPTGANVTPSEVTQTLDVRVGPNVNAGTLWAFAFTHFGGRYLNRRRLRDVVGMHQETGVIEVDIAQGAED